MKELLHEFYRQDPEYQMLSERKQIELFRDWVESQGIEAELRFEQRMFSILGMAVLALGAIIYPLNFLSDSLRWIQWLSLASAILFGLIYWLSRPRPVIRPGTTSRRAQP